MCDGSGTATGAILSLEAIGLQDTYTLSDDPKDSFFDYKTHRHSNFSLYHRSTKVDRPNEEPVNSTWPFGRTIIVNMKPQTMGDLLSNLFLKITLPPLQDYTNGSVPARYADQLGRHIFRKITMRVDETVLEITYDDWQIIYDELYRGQSDKDSLKYLINNGFDYNQLPESFTGKPYVEISGEDGLGPTELFIPIQMFFSRKYSTLEKYSVEEFYYKPYFPLCAIHKQKISFIIEFHKQQFFTNNLRNVSVPSFELVTEEITLSPEERNYLINSKIEKFYEVSRINPSITIRGNQSTEKNNLVPNIPVKSIHFFLRNEVFEDSQSFLNFKNRFNFSSNTAVVNQSSNVQINSNVYMESLEPIMNDTRVYFNNYEELSFLRENSSKKTHYFQKYLESHNKNFSSPNRNIYTYSLAIEPRDSVPTGSLDFEGLNSDRTFLDTKIIEGLPSSTNYRLNVFYTGYQMLTFENGFVSLTFAY